MRKALLVKGFRILITILVGSLPPAAVSLAQTSQAGAFTLEAVVLRGDPVSQGGDFFNRDGADGDLSGVHGLNDLGQVLIAGTGGNCLIGLHVGANRGGTRIVDFCHPTAFGLLSLLGPADINNAGQVVLNAGVVVNQRMVEMILLYSDQQLTRIATQGERSPAGHVFGGDCGFVSPGINNKGEIIFFACTDPEPPGLSHNGIYKFSEGVLKKIVEEGDVSPLGGKFSLSFANGLPVAINDQGDVLFSAGQLDPDLNVPERFGLFLATSDGIQKIQLSRDPLPNGLRIADNSIGLGALNNKGEVVYGVRLAGKPGAGIFLYAGGQTSKIILAGEPTPIGGTFDKQLATDASFGGARINDNGAVAIQLKVNGANSPQAIFLASAKAIVKVVGVGDRLPDGEKIRSISNFALNNLSEVAFFAHASTNLSNPLGVYLARPAAPSITTVKLKHKNDTPQLQVNGTAMITNDTVIEINGVPIAATDYPADSREDGGFTTQVISRDPRLAQMIPKGRTVQVTIYSPLTNLRSMPVSFAR